MTTINYHDSGVNKLLIPTLRTECKSWLPWIGHFEFRRTHFVYCCLIILALSVIDTYFVYRYQHVIVYQERNPICLYLINCDRESLSYFAIGKLLGNASAIATMIGVYTWRKHIGVIVVQAITAFQIGLIAYQLVG